MSKIKGIHTYRFSDNPEENRFAEAWDGMQKKPFSPGFIEDILLDDVSDRDRVVAATVIQWLGSPVGQGFLRELGYQKRKD